MQGQRVLGPYTMSRASRYSRVITGRGVVCTEASNTALERTAGSNALAAGAERVRLKVGLGIRPVGIT
jgi:hypothetical protein